MNERMGTIAAALEQTDMNWTGCFETTLWIGENDYRVVVSDGGECVEVKARFQEWADHSRYAAVKDRIEEINGSLSCGAFALDEARGEIMYRIYDLADGAPYSVQRMHALLNRCRDALERYGAELYKLQEESDPIWLQFFMKLFA